MDLIIRNATVVDGTRAPAFQADLAVKNDRIAAVGDLREARADREIDASGRVLSPGFIDIHTHADIALRSRPRHEPKVMQGVTTEVFSNCGLGFAPVTDQGLQIQREYLGGVFGDASGVDWSWRTVAQFLDGYRGRVATNVAYLIPHGALRVSAMGMAARPATADELKTMEDLARQGMDDGAFGLSTGLWYAPMSDAAPEENVGLCRAVGERGGFFAIHMREYADGVVAALDEACDMCRRSGAPLQVSHLQIGGAHNWGRSVEVLARLDQARAEGLDVTLDSYPYAAGSTMVQALLPGWATEGGPSALLKRLSNPEERRRVAQAFEGLDRDWTRHVLCGAQSSRFTPYEGEHFVAIARGEGLALGDMLCDLLEADELQACFIAHLGSEEDVETILAHPAQMVGSDGLHLPGKTHPRLYGTFPRLFSRYVREKGLLTLEEAVWKATGFPAQRLGLTNRGVVRAGAAADLVLFDPQRIHDTATFEDPCRHPDGIDLVLVNGRVAVEGGRHTGALAGEVLTPA
jgi:N-acyl-D-amino-acid deacylase